MDGDYSSSPYRRLSFFLGDIFDDGSCLIIDFHLRNKCIHPSSTMSRSIEDLRSTRLTSSTNLVNISQFSSYARNLCADRSMTRRSSGIWVLKLTEGNNVSCWVMRKDIYKGVVQNLSTAFLLTDGDNHIIRHPTDIFGSH